MKKITLLSSAVLIAMGSFGAYASLVPEQCSIGERPLDKPLRHVALSFDEEVSICKNAKAFVTNNGETVAEAVNLSISNNILGKDCQGWLNIEFDGECLPTGLQYVMHITAGSITTDNGIFNEEILIPFEVPANLGEVHFNMVEQNSEIESLQLLSCSWMFETLPVGEPEWELYRDGELVRKIRAEVTSDWDLGSAFLNFGETIHFEKGIDYSIVLPEGSVSAEHPGIVNKETILNFTGGYAGPLPSPSFIWCSLYADIPDIVNEVSFHFDIPIVLVPDKPIYFVENGPDNRRWSAVPYLTESDGLWIVTADFGGVELISGMGYTVEIPESTIVTANSDIAVNKKSSVSISNTGIDAVNRTTFDTQSIYNLQGVRITNPTIGGLYIKEGKLTRM